MELISVKEASKLINASDKTIRNWIDEKKLEEFKDETGKVMVDRRELLLQTTTIFSLYNYKGGIGKTTSSVVLADYFDKKKYKCLLVDFDPQANFTKAFFKPEQLYYNNKHISSLYDFFMDTKKSLSKIVLKYNDYIDLLPARLQMNDISSINDFELTKITSIFQTIFRKYQIVIIDSPPSLNHFTKLALLLSQFVFIPYIPEPFAYDGLESMLEALKDIMKFNSEFIDYRIFNSRLKGQKTIIHDSYISSVREQLSEKVLVNSLPEAISIVERGEIGKNIFNMVSGDTAQKITSICEEIDNYIFEERK